VHQDETASRIAKQLQSRSHSSLPLRNRRDTVSLDDVSYTQLSDIIAPPDLKSPTSDDEKALHKFLSDLFQAMSIACVLGVTQKEDSITASIYGNGHDLGLLIGKRGSTLDALQYIATLMINKGRNDRLRVFIQVGDYRQRREATLVNLAERSATKVMRDGHPVSLEPMSASERRIIHLTLQEHAHVETISSGVEPRRYVTVRLKSSRY
jgi:spoIIIJ-associated protein